MLGNLSAKVVSRFEQIKIFRRNIERRFPRRQSPIDRRANLEIYMIHGFGTIRDQLIPAIENGTDLFKIGCHCTETDTIKSHIEYLTKNNKEVYGILMMYHMTLPEKILEESRKMYSTAQEALFLWILREPLHLR